jgi:hypothetical protein
VSPVSSRQRRHCRRRQTNAQVKVTVWLDDAMRFTFAMYEICGHWRPAVYETYGCAQGPRRLSLEYHL